VTDADEDNARGAADMIGCLGVIMMAVTATDLVGLCKIVILVKRFVCQDLVGSAEIVPDRPRPLDHVCTVIHHRGDLR
jgi:hypothetical protein